MKRYSVNLTKKGRAKTKCCFSVEAENMEQAKRMIPGEIYARYLLMPGSFNKPKIVEMRG